MEEALYAGKMLGQYELLLPLAKGATASVWAARVVGSALEKIVAVKAMLSDLDADEDAESMFLDEARIASRIRHPHVASVLDLGDADDALYIVMEWVEGEPLQVLMREAKALGGIPMPLAVRIVKQAATGLHAAHELCDEAGKPLELVHRDISPQNILVGYDGAVKVIDFGVAKAEWNQQRTAVGQIKGKAQYMAPEQAMGMRVDRRADIFALGVVLYQLVTGVHPFRGDNEFATLARLRELQSLDPPSKYATVPAALDEVIVKAVTWDRHQRYATMLDFVRALDRAAPPRADDAMELAELMRATLAERANKKNQAIREALRAAGHTAMPVNLSPHIEASMPASKRQSWIGKVAQRKAAAKATAQGHGDESVVFPEAVDRRRTKLIATVAIALVALAVAAWAVAGSGTSHDGKPPAVKRSW